jgi:hypothetical protein
MVADQELKIMKFERCGVMSYNVKGSFEFVMENKYAKNTSAGVYLWLCETSKDNYKVMYAGKAGNGISTRMNQHIVGLRTAPIERIDRIRAAFGASQCLQVWFRESEEIHITALSVKKINAYSTEEEALIIRFAPELNRAKPPSMRAVSREGAKPLSAESAFTALSYELTNANGIERNLWDDALAALTESHRGKIGKIIMKINDSGSLRDRWMKLDFKVVRQYSRGAPICAQPLLVFGEISKRNFKENSQFVYISLERNLSLSLPTWIHRCRLR